MLPTPDLKPRRSILFTPAIHHHALLQVMNSSQADCLVVDLEDSIPPKFKQEARASVMRLFGSNSPINHLGVKEQLEVAIRINSLTTEDAKRDLEIINALPTVSTVVLPKLESVSELDTLSYILDSSKSLWVAIETPKGVTEVDCLLGHSKRVKAVFFGNNDFSRTMGMPSSADFPVARGQIIMSARKYGLMVFDGPEQVIPDLKKENQSFLKLCSRSRAQGFDGKAVIHPNQINIVNDAFKPSKEELEEARGIIELAKKEGPFVFKFGSNNQMIEPLHLAFAKDLLLISDAIREREGRQKA